MVQAFFALCYDISLITPTSVKTAAVNLEKFLINFYCNFKIALLVTPMRKSAAPAMS